ncbi:hypothetical protein QBC37DRAFT_329280 [Rhypophila decipiens]|uniref:Uncharacterized protein n=1 Tax=Rhypophila decipiens TaxID=261697 RepID=A0AAN7AYJ6_9PEZI|nr:hypothetical protein QBC37DRAFT_329280 [Rhypophila decipiens]
MSSSPMTYIPPLCDGACGTTPRSQMPMMELMMQDMMTMLRMMPTVCWTMVMQRRHMSWADMAHMGMQIMLACMEMCMMVCALPMYMMLPGAMFTMWMGVCCMVCMAMCWMLNGKEMMHQCVVGSKSWMMGQESDDEKWVFMGGMGMSSRHCHGTTLPILSKLFSRAMTCICMPTYGMPMDMLMMMLQRCMPLSTQAKRTLYAQMRCALLDDTMKRCVVLCHNHSAVVVSQVISQLCCDIPDEKLCKLEIYTFGSAAAEFMMPMGESSLESEMPHHMNMSSMHSMDRDSDSDMMPTRKGVHIEHFAMANDPFAQMGVLKTVRNNMDGRYCGGVFVMNDMSSMMNNPAMSMTSQQMSQNMTMFSSGIMMEDYLLSMFPAQLLPPSDDSGVPRSTMNGGMLDCTMMIDRDCGSKREIAAMGSYYAASGHKKTGNKRRSWTGLATMAGMEKEMMRNGMGAGMDGLEMVRKVCKDCDKHRGRDVSWLCRYAGMSKNGMTMGLGVEAEMMDSGMMMKGMNMKSMMKGQ